ncbi:zinc metalloproteinase-disintegrin-like MTP8 [Mobula birostris]|uniref:zinc metalloproteinase-disintegrin-like MTP8 n=1 Tax=Mobula birostris TaxID=1983395 RepID=UPI003B287133
MVNTWYIVCSLFFCYLVPQFVSSTSKLPGIRNYQVVKPRRLHVKQKRESEGLYPSVVRYGVPVEGKEVVIHLEKNEGLFAKNYSETYTLENGTEVQDTPVYLDHCYYHGYIKGDNDSAASFSTCDGLSGYIRTDGQRYLIEPLKESVSNEHALYRYEELVLPLKTCGVVNTSWDSPEPKVEETFNSPSERNAFLKAKKYIEMYVVADYSEFRKFGSVAAVRNRVFEAVNHINLLYRPLSTHVALIGLDIWSKGDKITVVADPNRTLRDMLTWRKTKLLPVKEHDNIQFITYVDFDGSTIGLAPMHAMCTSESGAINQDHADNVHGVASTMAHEMGHNLWMEHDDTTCICRTGTCIMSPSLSTQLPTEFSSCSQQKFQSFILNKGASCVRDVPNLDDIKAAPVCGNHFVEKGEDCDCGSPEECKNPCCEPKTCKMKEEAQCADGECCQDCKIKAAGSRCRSVKHECDLSENCDGKSNKCPPDAFRQNGIPCKRGMGFCYNGKCPTHQDQCESLWGPGARLGSRRCFEINTRGVQHGYCKKTTTYQGCKPKDVMCGQLHCVGGKMTLSYGYNIQTIGREVCNSFIERGGVNPGLVQDGIKCGTNKMCLNAECIEVKVNNCSNKCASHANCNHLGQCQFEEGYAPQNSTLSTTALIVIILIVVLILVAVGIGCFMYKKCTRKSTFLPRTQPPQAAGVTNPIFAKSAPSTPQMQRIHNPKGPMPGAPPPVPYAKPPPASEPPSKHPVPQVPPSKPMHPPPKPPVSQVPLSKPMHPPAPKILMPPSKPRN